MLRIAVSKSAKYVRGLALILMVAGVGARGAKAQGAAVPGQFQVGDRIALMVESPMAISDTLVVHDGLIATVPNVGKVPLKGVFRSDVQRYLTEWLGKYMKNPVVKAVALVRVSVVGPVGRPGFYVFPTDVVLSDVIMMAGGPGQMADLDKTVIVRSGKEVVGKDVVRDALAKGKTLNELNVSQGDEIIVGEQSKRNPLTYLQMVSAGLAITVALVTLHRYH